MAEGEDELLWIATGHGFLRWDQKTSIQKHYFPTFGSKTQLAFPSVRGIVYDGKYVILGPSDLGLWLFNPVNETYKRPNYASEEVRMASEGDFIDYLARLDNGQIIVPGRDHLYILDGTTYTLSFLDMPFARENNNFVFQTRDGMVWMTTLKGCMCWTKPVYHDRFEMGRRICDCGCPRGQQFVSTQRMCTGHGLIPEYSCPALCPHRYHGGAYHAEDQRKKYGPQRTTDSIGMIRWPTGSTF
jgi:hypothetical protein